MIKKIFGIGLIAGLVACGNAPQEKEEVHSHETEETHNHESHAEESAPTLEDRLVVNEGSRVFFVNLEDGAVVSSPVVVEMGVEGMEISPAGEIISGTGHHHILINNEAGFHETGTVVPADDNNIHFGKGQTETSLELAPGTYKLSLQLANGFHESYGAPLSASITITVE